MNNIIHGIPLRRRNGIFTLIELLIVIAMMAILAGMLLPALNSAREKAQSISCLSKIKQVNLAMNVYADSHDDYLPPRGGRELYWTKALEFQKKAYSKTEKIAVCPTLEVNGSHSVALIDVQAFGINIWITGGSDNATAANAYQKRGRIVGYERKDFVANTTSGVVLFGDSVYTKYDGTFGDFPVQYLGIAVKYGNSGNGAVHFRHSGDTANFGMLDGSGANMNFASAYNRSCITKGVKKNLTFIEQAL